MYQTPPLPPPLEGRGVAALGGLPLERQGLSAPGGPPLERPRVTGSTAEAALRPSTTGILHPVAASLWKPPQPIAAWLRNVTVQASAPGLILAPGLIQAAGQVQAADQGPPRCLPTSHLAQPSQTPPACHAVVVSIDPVSYSLFVKVFFYHLGQHLSGPEKQRGGGAFPDAQHLGYLAV